MCPPNRVNPTPLKEQFNDVKKISASNLAHEGVNCAVCHVREGQIFSPTGASNEYHTTVKSDLLKDAQFCAGCHQFNFATKLHAGVATQSLAVQGTYKEWLSYKEKGGTYSCQACHMPEGRHIFRGVHDHEFLKDTIKVRVKKSADHYDFHVKADNTGHNFPTGDVFRHLTLEILFPGKSSFKTVARFGRKFRTVKDASTGNTIQELVEDTSLAPFEERKVQIHSMGPLRYRVRYNYTSEFNEWRTLLNLEDLVVTLIEGTAEK